MGFGKLAKKKDLLTLLKLNDHESEYNVNEEDDSIFLYFEIKE